MKIKAIVGILALLCSPLGFAATVTVTPSIANPVPLGAFSVMVSSADMSTTTGATLGVTYDAAVISIGTATAILPNFNFAVFTPTGVGTGLISVISTSVAGIAGPFDAFTLNLTALAPGDANLVFVEDNFDLGWSDPTATLISGVVYDQATITVAGATAPDIVVTDLDFGDITVGSPSTQTVTVTNNGDAALDVGAVTAPAAPFTLGADTCSNTSIPAAGTCTIDVVFDPTVAGAASSSLDIPSNDADTPTATVALSGNGVTASTPDIAVDTLDVQFGSITVGSTNTQTVTVTNSGTAALVVGAVTAPAAPFTLGADTCSGQTIAAAGTCTIEVNFDPVAAVTDSSSLDIPSNDADTPTATVAVSGTGVTAPTPNIDVDSLNVPFGDITVGGTSQQIVTVTNSGSAALDVGAVTAPAAPFTLGTDGCSNQSLAAAASCTIEVNFDPVAAGAASSSLDIPSNDPDTAIVTVTVAGNGVSSPVPNIVVTDSVVPNDNLIIPFGTITAGGTSQQTVTVTNSGSATLDVGQVAGLVAPFSLGTDTCSNQAIAPAGSCTIEVNFDPVEFGLFSSSLDIPSNDPDAATVTVSVSGTGTSTSGPAISVTDSVSPYDDLQIPFGNVYMNAAMEQTVTVTNQGSADLVIGTVGGADPLVAPFSIIPDSDRCSGQTLSPAESCNILVVYAPTAIGVNNESFDIPSNDPDDPSVTIAVSGTGTRIVPSGSYGSSAFDPLTLVGLALVGFAGRRRRR